VGIIPKKKTGNKKKKQGGGGGGQSNAKRPLDLPTINLHKLVKPATPLGEPKVKSKKNTKNIQVGTFWRGGKQKRASRPMFLKKKGDPLFRQPKVFGGWETTRWWAKTTPKHKIEKKKKGKTCSVDREAQAWTEQELKKKSQKMSAKERAGVSTGLGGMFKKARERSGGEKGTRKELLRN